MMNLLKSISNFLLKSKLTKKHRNAVFKNWQDIQQIGIIYNTADKDAPGAIKKIRKLCKNEKQLEIIAFGNTNENNASSSEILFDNKDLTFFLFPKSNAIKQFTQKNFDLLIDLNTENECIAIQNITSLSNSPFKIGGMTVYQETICDIYISEPGQSISTFIEYIFHYLKKV